jgi:hypothetical protein
MTNITRKPQYLDWNTHIQYHLNTTPPNKLLQILAPAGSGKTYIIIDFLKKLFETRVKALILHPYRVSKAEYDEVADLGYEVKYFIELIKEIDDRIPKDIPYTELEYLKQYEKEAYEYLKHQNYAYVFLDEIDFFFIQAQASKHGATFLSKLQSRGTTTTAKLITSTILQLIRTCSDVISISANKIILPKDIIYIPNYRDNFIHTVKINLKPNTIVNSFRIIDLDKFNNMTVTRIKRLLIQKHKNKPCLVYSPRFSKPEFKMLMEESIFIITRDENTPKVKSPKGYLQSILHDYPKCRAIGDFHRRDLLTDKLVNRHKMLAVNTSSTRSLSLTENYGLATIIIFTNSWTASASQICARFRNTPVDVIWATRNPEDLNHVEHDPFLWDWSPQPEFVTKPLAKYSLKKDRIKEAEPFFDLSKYKSMRAAYLAYKAIYPSGFSRKTFTKYLKKFIGI